MKRTTHTILALALAGIGSASLAAGPTAASDIGNIDKEALSRIFPSRPPYSPYAGRNFPARPLFGDTHVHTSYSLDAGAAGARLGPAEAFRFGKGEEVMASSGQRVRPSRPLDFTVVADHSDGFGLFPRLIAGDPLLLSDPRIREWYDMIQAGDGMQVAFEIVQAQSSGDVPKVFVTDGFDSSRAGYRSAWHQVIEAAEAANEPGRFTAFIGWEWTSNFGGNGKAYDVAWGGNREPDKNG